MSNPSFNGILSDIHSDIVISGLNTLYLLYPYLTNKPVKVFIEANLSHDLPACVHSKVANYFSGRLPISFVKQHDSKGRILPGVLTRHKANLVAYFKTALDRGMVFIARQFVTVSRLIEIKYRDVVSLGQTPFGVGLVIPDISDMENMLKIFIEQATMFRCYPKGNGIIYSGKRGNGGNAKVDDLIMSLILCIAWARLPENTYVLQ